MSLSQLSIEQFLDELASPAPAPGGGAAAALSGALGAALIAMVCRLTIGRKNYEEISPTLEQILPRAEERRQLLTHLMEADSTAYDQVIQTMKLPKVTDEQKAARTDALQTAFKQAAEVPFQIAGACADLLDLIEPVVRGGNKNAASDAGAGALLAEAGLRAAVMNVRINLGLIKDAAYVSEMYRRLKPFTEGRTEQVTQLLNTVEARL